MAITLVHDCDVLRRAVPQAKEGDYRDTEIRSNTPNTNHDATQWNAGVISTGGNGTWYRLHALFYYDLRAFIPASATLVSAIWHFYVLTNDTGPLHQYLFNRLVRTFKEAEATWNVYTTGNLWTLPGALHATNDHDHTVFVQPAQGWPSGTGWKTINLTTIASDAWSNRSGICTFMMRRYDAYLVEQGHIQAHAKEYEPYGAFSHHLRITYTLDGRTFQAFIH